MMTYANKIIRSGMQDGLHSVQNYTNSTTHLDLTDEQVDGMAAWCDLNCNHNPTYCPLSHCNCVLLKSWQDKKNHLCGPEIHNRLSKCERSVIHNKLSLICVDQFKMTLFERNADLTNGVVRQVSGEIFAQSRPLSILASKLFSSYSSICAVKYIQNFFLSSFRCLWSRKRLLIIRLD